MVKTFNEAIRRIKTMIPVYRPWVSTKAFENVKKALGENNLSYGPFKEKAAKTLATLGRAKHVLLTCNGTAATHLLFEAVRFKYPYAARLVFPSNCYVAAWNASQFGGQDFFCLTVDAKLDTWNADYESIGMADENTVFVIVHNLGNPVNVPALKRRFPKSIFIEDNCEAFFNRYEEYAPTGSASFCSSTSFFGNKTITCGEGGAFFTDDDATFDHISRIYSQGQTEKRYVHDRLAYNYRMSEVQAAVLDGQLDDLGMVLIAKRNAFEVYRQLISEIPGVVCQIPETGCPPSNWMFGVRIEGLDSYETVEKFMLANGIETRPMFYPITAHSHLRLFNNQSTEISKKLSRECVVLPSFPDLTLGEIEHVAQTLKKFVES